MLNHDHQNFLGKYFKSNDHYSFDEAPKAFLKHSPDVTPEIIDRALKHEGSGVKMLAIQHPNFTSEQIDRTLDDFSYEDSDLARAKVIQRKDVSVSQLEKATNDPHWYVRLATAKNPNVTKEQLFKLLHDEDSDVRYHAGANKSYVKHFPNGHQ